ncbi:MAG: rhodanese-like domain-containing protein [Rhodospirillales bacterium]|nr:rhodanese-like domain-containing protein [Rhodospirillales bacterium]
MNDKPYAGDVLPAEAYAALQTDNAAVLVDVRTEPEWQFVGVPDLSGIDKQVRLVQWQTHPGGVPNDRFVEECVAAGLEKGQPIYFLCRSGVRSMHAAVAMTARGYGPCYNVAQGFEGDKDAAMQRGRTGGWKVAGLPWRQG